MDKNKLHLFGTDKEDFEVLSSLLQDAAVPISDMKFEIIKNQFFMVCSRYVWENKINFRENKRVVTGVCFDNVTSVKKRNLPPIDSQYILNFLTIEKRDQFIELIFSDGILIKLEGKMISFRIDDLNKEWPTIFFPSHDIENE